MLKWPNWISFLGGMEMFCIILSLPSINSPGPDIFSTLLLCASLTLQRFELAGTLLSLVLHSGCAACGTHDWLLPVCLQRWSDKQIPSQLNISRNSGITQARAVLASLTGDKCLIKKLKTRLLTKQAV